MSYCRTRRKHFDRGFSLISFILCCQGFLPLSSFCLKIIDRKMCLKLWFVDRSTWSHSNFWKGFHVLCECSWIFLFYFNCAADRSVLHEQKFWLRKQMLYRIRVRLKFVDFRERKGMYCPPVIIYTQFLAFWTFQKFLFFSSLWCCRRLCWWSIRKNIHIYIF